MRLRRLILLMLAGALWSVLTNAAVPVDMTISIVRESASTELLGSLDETGETEEKWFEC